MKLKTSRIEAAKAGHATYHGPPCKAGHAGERYTRNGTCIVCARATTKARNKLFRDLIESAKCAPPGL